MVKCTSILAAGLLAVALLVLGGCSENEVRDPVSPPTAADRADKSGGLPGVDTIVVTSDPVRPSAFVVAWSEPGAPSRRPGTVARYAVAINYSAVIGRNNWKTTTRILEVVPAGQAQYARAYDAANPDVVAGASAWITVVPYYTQGAHGDIAQNVAHRITAGFVISGTVISDQGAPLAGIEVAIPAPGLSTRTNEGGAFRFEPLSDEQAFVLRTNAPGDWHDYTTTAVGATDPTVVICLLGRAPLEFPIADLNYRESVGFMTKWFYHNVGTTRPYVRWASFPLTVHVAEGLNDAGTVDMGAAVRDQMAYLNAAIGQQMWTEVPDSASAQIVVGYDRMSAYYGVNILNPGTAGAVWGAVPPVKIRMIINPVLATEDIIRRMINHEFGHSLYIKGHSTSLQHLMNAQGGFSPGVPTADDLRLFRAATTIPIGTDFNRYED